MASTISLITKLRRDFAQFTFIASDEFRWSPDAQTIFYDEASGDAAPFLHEVGHAVLCHQSYNRDIHLLEMERDAWEYAERVLSRTYSFPIDETTVQSSLDTYREWMHARSICPACNAVGIQTKKNQYTCIACRKVWRVNSAKMCALRRYTLTT